MDKDSLLFENIALREMTAKMEDYIKSLQEEITRLNEEKRILEIKQSDYFGYPHNGM